jgi:hypothetical protein
MALLRKVRVITDLAALGAILYQIQQGAVKLSDPPAKHEWIAIRDETSLPSSFVKFPATSA